MEPSTLRNHPLRLFLFFGAMALLLTACPGVEEPVADDGTGNDAADGTGNDAADGTGDDGSEVDPDEDPLDAADDDLDGGGEDPEEGDPDDGTEDPESECLDDLCDEEDLEATCEDDGCEEDDAESECLDDLCDEEDLDASCEGDSCDGGGVTELFGCAEVFHTPADGVPGSLSRFEVTFGPGLTPGSVVTLVVPDAVGVVEGIVDANGVAVVVIGIDSFGDYTFTDATVDGVSVPVSSDIPVVVVDADEGVVAGSCPG